MYIILKYKLKYFLCYSMQDLNSKVRCICLNIEFSLLQPNAILYFVCSQTGASFPRGVTEDKSMIRLLFLNDTSHLLYTTPYTSIQYAIVCLKFLKHKTKI